MSTPFVCIRPPKVAQEKHLSDLPEFVLAILGHFGSDVVRFRVGSHAYGWDVLEEEI